MEFWTSSGYWWSLKNSVATNGKPQTFLTAAVLCLRTRQAKIVNLKDWGKKSIEGLHFSFRWLSPTSIGPIFSSLLLLLLTYFKKFPSCVAQHWPVSTPDEFRPFVFSPWVCEPQLCKLPVRPGLVSRDGKFLLLLKLHKEFPVQPSTHGALKSRFPETSAE